MRCTSKSTLIMDKEDITTREAEQTLPGAATDRADHDEVSKKQVEQDVCSLNNNPRNTDGPRP